MKILTILGSPKKHGNTATVLNQFEALSAPTHAIERINLADYTLRDCLGCNVCQGKLNEPGCVQKDDTTAIIDRILAADVVIYATPLYAWSFSASMKALIDRQYCLTKWHGHQLANALLAGKPTALLVTCAGPVEGNTDLIQTTFDRIMSYTQSHMVGQYIVPFCTTPDQLGDSATATAKAMFNDISQLARSPSPSNNMTLNP
ncbi:MAG TPA: flavodoxin family protein [Crinalium sp.]